MFTIRNGNKRLWSPHLAGQGFAASRQSYFGAAMSKVGRIEHYVGGFTIIQKDSFRAFKFFSQREPASWIMCVKTPMLPNEAFELKWALVDPRSYFRSPTPGARYG